MELSTTGIVAIVGVIGLLFLNTSLRGKLTSFLSRKQGAHDATQDNIEVKVEDTKKEIAELQNKVKELDEKGKVTANIVKQVINSGNKKVDEVLKDPKMEELIKEFDKW